MSYSYKIEKINPLTFKYWQDFKGYIKNQSKHARLEICQDVMQDALFIIDKLLKSYNPNKGRLFPYIFRWLGHNIRTRIFEYSQSFTMSRHYYAWNGTREHELRTLPLDAIDREIVGKNDDIERDLDIQTLQNLVRKAINYLPDREKYVISRIYGIESVKQTGAEIAEFLNISQARVYQIKSRALKRIAARFQNSEYHSNIGALLDYET